MVKGDNMLEWLVLIFFVFVVMVGVHLLIAILERVDDQNDK